VIRQFFEAHHFVVQTARDGVAALQLFAVSRPCDPGESKTQQAESNGVPDVEPLKPTSLKPATTAQQFVKRRSTRMTCPK
jgi:hypothetical protein